MEINQKHSLPAGSGANWQMKIKTGVVTKCYLVNTFVDPTYSCLDTQKQYKKIVYHI